MKARILLILWITVFVVSGMVGCTTTTFNPGPDGPIGPQGDLGPKGPLGPDSSCDDGAIVIEDTGTLEEREFQLNGFSKLLVSDFFDVEILQGENFRVILEAEKALLPYIAIAVQGDTLNVGLKPGYLFCFDNASQRVQVTLPVLTHVQVINHSTVVLSGFEAGDSLQLAAIDFGMLSGAVEAGEILVEVSNHGDLTLTGSATQVTGDVLDFGSADLTGLDAAEIDIYADEHSTLDQ